MTRSPWLRRTALAALAGAVLVAALAWWVLESSGVAIVETERPDGGVRRTHVWYAIAGDLVWLEAGRPEHGWYLDVQREPRLRLSAEDLEGEFVASTVPGQQAHEHVRTLLRMRYGLRDRLLGLVIDTSPSIAVLLTRVTDHDAARSSDRADPP